MHLLSILDRRIEQTQAAHEGQYTHTYLLYISSIQRLKHSNVGAHGRETVLVRVL